MLRRASYLFFAISEDGRKAVDLVRPKLAFLLRNKLLKENIAVTGVPVDQERIIDAISRRGMDEAARLVSDDAVEAFSICGTAKSCSERLEAFIESGINEPVLMVMGEKPDTPNRTQSLKRLFVRRIASSPRAASRSWRRLTPSSRN
jgi:alkanesulfonate monooxygenase SsuD/methylene tetrahydromethanopterin reductase-like flavin-dependent oxidoreductase (luciferase family)